MSRDRRRTRSTSNFPGFASRLGCALTIATAVAGCATLETGRAEKGDLAELLGEQINAQKPREGRPLALLFGKFDVRVVDPISEATLWRRGYKVVGRPAADGDSVYLPVKGRRIIALDRLSGARRWAAGFEGEIVTGVAANGAVVVVTSTDGRRAYATAYDAVGGSLLWSKDTAGRLGVPGLVGKVAVVPLEGQLLALAQLSGRERARFDLPFPAHDWQVVRRQAAAVVVAGEDGFVDVLRPKAAPRRFRDSHGPFARAFAQMDPGLDDGARIAWWAPVPQDGGPPETAVFMARRAVLGVHLGADGRPDGLRWIHLAPRGDEHVALDVSYGRVNLVRESGALLALSAEDGRMFAFREGDAPVRGAALFDHDQFFALGDRAFKSGDASAIERIYLEPEVDVDERVASLLEDPDPRLWPAQALAVEVVARYQRDVNALEVVTELARGQRRGDNEGFSAQLRALAQLELAATMGAEGERLGDPIHGATPLQDLSLLARQAAHRGDVGAVDDLAGHLLHPNTPARDLGAVAEAICALDQPAGTRALAEFVRLYHADPEAAIESDALVVALACLWAQREVAPIARGTLDLVRRDPFTDPSLRDYMDRSFGDAGAPVGDGVQVLADGPEPDSPDASAHHEPSRPPALPDPRM